MDGTANDNCITRTESGFCGSATSNDQLVVLIGTGTQKYQRCFECFAYTPIGFNQSENSLVKMNHLVDIGDIDAKVRWGWAGDFQHDSLQISM